MQIPTVMFIYCADIIDPISIVLYKSHIRLYQLMNVSFKNTNTMLSIIFSSSFENELESNLLNSH